MEIKAPDLGVDSAEVTEIMVKVGDNISADDNIMLVESDKASVEIPAGISGTVTAILVNAGDHISQGSSLVTVEAVAGETSQVSVQEVSAQETPAQKTPVQEVQAPVSEPTPATATPSSQTYTLPDLGVESATVAEIMVKVGDSVEIIGTGNGSAYGTSNTAYGIGWKRSILRIYEGQAFPYMVGNSTGVTGFYKADALKKL